MLPVPMVMPIGVGPAAGGVTVVDELPLLWVAATAPPAAPAPAPTPFARAANLAAASGGNARTFEFGVTVTVIVFFVVRSFSVSVPFAASMVVISPARFLNDPLTTTSA